MPDNLSETSSYWNGRFGNTVNLNYTELFNVDPVDVPYNNIGRVNSYFLQTRGAYIEDRVSRVYANVWKKTGVVDDTNTEDFHIVDAKIIYDEDCEKKTGKIWLSYINTNKTKKAITFLPIENWQILRKEEWIRIVWWWPRVRYYPTDKCCDNRLHIIDYVKNELVDNVWEMVWVHFYEENKKVDWVVVEWFLWIEELDKDWVIYYNGKEINTMSWYLLESWIKEWDYVMVHSSDWEYDSWSCGQVRQILWVDESNTKIIVSSPRLWMRDIEENKSSRKWFGVEIKFFRDWWETICYSTLKGINIVSERNSYVVSEWYDRDWGQIHICDYWLSLSDEKIVVSDMEVYNNRLCILYSNGYIQYWLDWYNLLFLTTDNLNYVGKDKLGLISWRDVLLVLWKSKIDVGAWDQNNDSLVIYTQTKVIGVHNKYSFWEYEGSICIISSEEKPRLLAAQIVNNTWVNNMLQFEDIGWYIQSRLDKLRDEDEVYVSTMNNDLRIYINICNAPNLCHHPNSTRILFFNKKFQIRHEHLTHSIIHWNIENIYYWSWLIYYQRFEDNWDLKTQDNYYLEKSWSTFWTTEETDSIKSHIMRYINENEYNNWQVDANGWPIDLFRIIKMKSMNILLWYWLYSKHTKIKITNYRFWLGSTLVIDNLYKNKGIEWISKLANGIAPDDIKYPEDKERVMCMYDDVSDNEAMDETCDNKLTLSDVEREKMLWYWTWVEEWDYDRIRLNDVGLCVNRWRYLYSNVYPLHINVNETQKPSEMIKIELSSEDWDFFSFGWAIVELNVYPLDYTGADNEYGLDFDEDCPKRFIRDTWGCFRNLIQ